MAQRHSEEFRREAIRIDLTSGLSRRQVASDLGLAFSTLSKWIQKSPHSDILPTVDLAMENDWRRKENRRLKEDGIYKKATVFFAHIREQHHLSLGSYGRPRMTQELKEISTILVTDVSVV